MSANAGGKGDDTFSNVNASQRQDGTGEESSASNISTAGGPMSSGPAKHTTGPHKRDWQNVLDPRFDSNAVAPQVRAEARAEAKAEGERSEQATEEIARAKARGDFEAERRAELEQYAHEQNAAAATARLEGRLEAERELRAHARQAERDKQRAVTAARANARAEFEAEEEARRAAEAQRAEEQRMASKGGVRDAVKSIAKNAQGAGDSIRGRFNAGVEESFGRDPAVAAQHRETAARGEQKIGLNRGPYGNGRGA